MERYLVTLDIGTSSIRGMLFDRYGKVHLCIQKHYEILKPFTHWQEQEPAYIYKNVVEALKLLLKRCKEQEKFQKIAGISISSQMYSIFPIDKNGEALMNSILWSDSRSEKETDILKERYGEKYFYEETGCPLSPMYPLSKILWIKRNKKELLDKVYKFISIKEYVTAKMTGSYVVDYSIASATGIFNIKEHQWSDRALKALGYEKEKFSIPVNTEFQMKLSPNFLKEIELEKSIPLVIGGGDGPLANLGSLGEKGSVNIDLGTSGAARFLWNKAIVDEECSLWCYCLNKDLWTYGGILSNVGNTYKWLAENILFCEGEVDYKKLDSYLADKDSNSEELYFLPYLLKSRIKSGNNLKGLIYGLSLEHSQKHIVKALIEGISFDLLNIINLIEKNANEISKIILTGGLSKSFPLVQIISNILGREIYIPESSEGSSAGAAILGFSSLGLIDGLRFEKEKDNRVEKIVIPELESKEFYKEKFTNFTRLCNSLKGI